MDTKNIEVKRTAGKVTVTIPIDDSSHVHVRTSGENVIISPAIVLDQEDPCPNSGGTARKDRIHLSGDGSSIESSILIEDKKNEKIESKQTKKNDSATMSTPKKTIDPLPGIEIRRRSQLQFVRKSKISKSPRKKTK